jgi:hypothetical protein
MRSPLLLCGAIVVVVGLAAASARAEGGVVEINQACATSLAGCFPGDAGGFPVTIAARGSYRLTSNLDLPNANTSGIEINASSVAIDLGGFTIRGVTVCSGVPVSSCTQTGSGVGILGGSDVRVHHGAVAQMGNDGIRLGYASRVEDVHAFSNGGSGIELTTQGYARGNEVTSNLDYGIITGVEARLADNVTIGNRLAGLFASSGVVTGNMSSRNGGEGANLGLETSFSGNTFTGNTAGSLAGGKATGGNVCDDGKCTHSGARRYYLSQNSGNGALALLVCASGFHMASLWEVREPASLEYDRTLGIVSPDSGAGPPTDYIGWIRTGYSSFGQSSIVGRANCNAWTSTSGFGSVVRFESDYSLTSKVDPISAYSYQCSDSLPVWCVED